MVMTECKKILLARCVVTLLKCVLAQFIFVFLFLFIVNAHPLHPISTLTIPIGALCSLGTLIYMVPLISVVIFFCVIHVKINLAEKHFYESRYKSYIIQNGRILCIYIGAHLLLGLTTAWLYSSYLPDYYKEQTYDCFGQRCINGYYFALITIGAFAGAFHYYKTFSSYFESLEFGSIVAAPTKRDICLKFVEPVLKSCRTSTIPAIAFAIIYAVFASSIGLWSGAMENVYIILTWLIYMRNMLLIAVLVDANISLIKELFALAFAQELELSVEAGVLRIDDKRNAILADALAPNEPYIIHCLAARFFYNLNTEKRAKLRAKIFQLSHPGNNPRNWRALSEQCLSILKAYTQELSDSINKIPAIREAGEYDKATSLNMRLQAEKILLRQFNDKFGIRNITSPERNQSTMQPTISTPAINFAQQFNAQCAAMTLKFRNKFYHFIWHCPLIRYFFGEEESAKTAHLLMHSYPIVWLVKGFAHISVASVTEDKYGVLQRDLPQIISALLNLKNVLDRFNIISHKRKFYETNYRTLKDAVTSSLKIIGDTFRNYLGEIIPNTVELEQICEMMQSSAS